MRGFYAEADEAWNLRSVLLSYKVGSNHLWMREEAQRLFFENIIKRVP